MLLRLKGHTKGKQKKQTGNFKLVRRTTDPQTVYVKSALHRDDIIDITDFDYVAYLYNIDRLMLNEELATAIMLGDGRDDGDEGKISPDHIRPIWLDDDLYTIHVDLDVAAAKKELQGTNTAANFGENYIIAEAMINTVLYAREDYKGTGTPDLFITPHMLNQMLLARDINGRRIYSSKTELATALNVGSINTAEQFEGKTRTTSDSKRRSWLPLSQIWLITPSVQPRAERLLTSLSSISTSTRRNPCLRPDALVLLLVYTLQSQSKRM